MFDTICGVRSFCLGLLAVVATCTATAGASARPDPAPVGHWLEGVPIVVPSELQPQTTPTRVARIILRQYRRGGGIDSLTLYRDKHALEDANPEWGRSFFSAPGPMWYVKVSGWVENCRATPPTSTGPCPSWMTSKWIVSDSDEHIWGFGAP